MRLSYFTVLAAALGLAAAPVRAEDMTDRKSDGAVNAKTKVAINGPFRVVKAGKLELRTPLGSDTSHLLIARAQADSPNVYYTSYSGTSLDEILENHPEVANEPDFTALRTAINSPDASVKPVMQVAPWRLTFVEGPVRYETWRGADKAHLYVTTDEGTLVYCGRDLNTIVSTYPVLRERNEITSLRSRVALLPEYKLRTQSVGTGNERSWMDMTIEPRSTTVTVYDLQDDNSWSTQSWTGSDYRVIARSEPKFRQRAATWFDLNFGADLPDLPAPTWGEDTSGRNSDDAAIAKANVSINGPYRVVKAGKLEWRTLLGSDTSHLLIARGQANSPNVYYTSYSGADLDAVLESNPELANEPDFVALRTGINSPNASVKPVMQVAPWRLSFVEGPVRYETWRGSDQAHLYVTANDETNVYYGKDLNSIVATYPVLRERSEIANLRSRVALMPEYKLRTQSVGKGNERSWMDMSVEGDSTTVKVYELQDDNTWSTQSYEGRDYREIARSEPKFRERAPTWFDLNFDVDLPALPAPPKLPNPFN